jgi:diketogulonate reductase-like aldo/keto reductase
MTLCTSEYFPQQLQCLTSRANITDRSFWTLSGSPLLLSNPALLSLATLVNGTPEQALFKYAQSQGIVPLSGTTSEEHMKEDTAVEHLTSDSASKFEQAIKAVKEATGTLTK